MIKNLINLFFPQVCYGCNALMSDNEKSLCTECRHNLPTTNFDNDTENAVHKMLYGRVKLENATALLHFSKKGIVQQLMHNLKYRGHEDIGHFLGEWMGEELRELKAYENIDVVVPVPLHKSKLRKRGYNQVDKFGKAIAKALNTEYDSSILLKTRKTKTQVFKNRLKRGSEIDSRFSIKNPERIRGKHILLVDDIITTGATIEACANALNMAGNISLSIVLMSITD
ncbi:MAG: ComF family protein [Bacteroidota bacterium]